MVAELYTTSKPATPRRALFLSILMLLATGGLAAQMSWVRAGDPLGTLVEPPGWTIAFRVPKRFQPTDSILTPRGPAYVWHSRLPRGGMATLMVVRAPSGPSADAGEVCRRFVGDYQTFADSSVNTVRIPPMSKPIGPFPGVEMSLTSPAVVIRAACLNPVDAYVVITHVDNGQVDDALYRLFEATCASIRTRP